jgi:hypothetical protein
MKRHKRTRSLVGLLPTDLVRPICPAVKRIKTEYNRRVSNIRISIPDAYHNIQKLNYKLAKLTAPVEIRRVQRELTQSKGIILRAQAQMRTAHQEKIKKIKQIKSPAIFRYLNKKDKIAAVVATFHTWSPSLLLVKWNHGERKEEEKM